MKFKYLLEMMKETKELKEIIDNGEDPSEYWAENVLYNGSDLFKKYMDFLGWFEKHTDKLKDDSWEEEECDEVMNDDGEYEEDCWMEYITRSKQESYLGYIPSSDTFITGFDMWEGDDNPAGIVYWKIDGSRFIINSEEIDYSSTMIYNSSNGAYKKLHIKHKDLVDIRLD